MMKSDRRSSEKKEAPAPENERVDRDVSERAPADYYYDDSTGYEIYEGNDEDKHENEQPPGSEQERF